MVNIKPTIEIYDSEGDLTRAYSKAFDKMNDVTMDVDLSQFDFDEVYKGKCKEFDDLVTKLCKQSGLDSDTIYALLLTRFTDEDEYLMDYDVMYTYGLDELEESKKTTKRNLKESNYDLINDDLLAMCKGSTKQLIYAIDDYQSNYSDRSLKELKRRIEEVEDFCNKILYQINKR